ncbi:MAG: endonuclease, partial [Oscillospiraceae bacterium]|nr:endonuclease [Oscillospiraceae bacterium]
MKMLAKKGLALLLAIVMVIGFIPNLSIYANAATYTYNWGVRGEEATALSSAAVAFYSTNAVTYDSLSAKEGAADTAAVPNSELYLALKTLMAENHTYTNSYEAAKELLAYTDCVDGNGKPSCFYTGNELGEWDGGATWNREHTWPQSKSSNDQNTNDVMLLRPTTSTVNSSRNNTAYGESSGYYFPNKEATNGLDIRGDVARSMLYGYVRWGNAEK